MDIKNPSSSIPNKFIKCPLETPNLNLERGKNDMFYENQNLNSNSLMNMSLLGVSEKDNSFNFSIDEENFLDKDFLRLINSSHKAKSRSNSSDFSEFGKKKEIKKFTSNYHTKNKMEKIESPKKKNTEFIIYSPSRILVDQRFNKEIYYTPEKKEAILKNLSALNTPDKSDFNCKKTNIDDSTVVKIKKYSSFQINRETLLRVDQGINFSIESKESNHNSLDRGEIKGKKEIGNKTAKVKKLSTESLLNANNIEKNGDIQQNIQINLNYQFTNHISNSNNTTIHYHNNFSGFSKNTQDLHSTQIGNSDLNSSNYTNICDLNEFKKLNLEENSNFIIFLAKDQYGCRYLQNILVENPSIADNVIFKKVLPYLDELIIDPLGNYFIQKLFEYLSEFNLVILIDKVSQMFYSICTNQYGTRSIQRLIDFIGNQTIFKKFNFLIKQNILELAKDQYGNHVIQKYLIKFPNYSYFIVDEVAKNFLDIASDKYGCIIFQKCIEISELNIKLHLINLILSNTFCLISDEFGNYIIQYIVSLKNQEFIRVIVSSIINYILNLCKQKYSSNVIERILEYGDHGIRQLLISQIYKIEVVEQLIFDVYGNYIIQKALAISTEPYFSLLIKNIIPFMSKLRRVSFGMKLYHKLISTYPQIKEIMFIRQELPSQHNHMDNFNRFQEFYYYPPNNFTNQQENFLKK